jgi:hypothetical protein
MHDTSYTRPGPALQRLAEIEELGPRPLVDLSPEKIKILYHDTNWRHFQDSALICMFYPYKISQVADVLTGVTGSEFRVNQNSPNPFSDITRLSFFTPKAEMVELRIYNIVGNLVHQEAAMFSRGTHRFDFNGSSLPPGTYLYRVEIRDAYFTGKILKSR